MITLSTTSLGRHVNQAGALAVNIQLQAGILQVLGNQYVTYVLEAFDFGRDLASDGERLVKIIAADLNIDGRGQALIDHGVDQAAGLEVGGEFRHIGGENPADPLHVLRNCRRCDSL